MILLGADPLSQFLNRAAARPFVWGEFDCLLWLADWIVARRDVDPASNLRGSYSTMLGAARVVKDAGGMTTLVARTLKPFSIPRAAVAARGDIAVVQVGGDGGEHFGNQAGVILLGGTAALICQSGLICPRVTEVPPLAIWRV